MSLRAEEIIAVLVQEFGTPLGPVDQVLAGDPEATVHHVGVTTMATQRVLRQAHAQGVDLLLTHEPLYFDHRDAACAVLHEDPVFLAKQRFLAEAGIVVWHWHDQVHRHVPDLIDTGALAALGWQREADSGAVRIAPTTLGDLAIHVASRLGAQALCYLGDPDAQVRTVALNLGFRGFETNRAALVDPEVDVLIAGEVHEWETGEYAADAVTLGLAAGMIVVGHVSSEEAGMRAACDRLARRLGADGVRVSFLPAPRALRAPAPPGAPALRP